MAPVYKSTYAIATAQCFTGRATSFAPTAATTEANRNYGVFRSTREILRKQSANRTHSVFSRLRRFLRKHLSNRNRAMFHGYIARQGGVNARALARRADGIDSVIVVVADLRHELRLQHIAVADREARRMWFPTRRSTSI